MFGYIYGHIKQMSLSPLGWVAGLLGVVFVRFLLESVSNPSSSGLFAVDTPTLLHYFLFFVTLGLFIMIFLKLFVPELLPHIHKLTIFSLAGLWIAPIVDLVANGASGSPMVYILNSFTGIIKSSIYFFSSNAPFGSTLGLQVEIAIILVCIFLLIYKFSKDVWKSLGGTLFFYAVLFVLVSMPSIPAIIFSSVSGPADVIEFLQRSIAGSATVFNNLEGSLEYSDSNKFLDVGFNFMIGRIFLFLSIILTFVWFWMTENRLLRAIIKNSRPERVANYLLLVLFGVFFALRQFGNTSLNWNDYLSALSLLVSIYFSIMFAICINDIEDVEIDKLTNQDRPLATGGASKEELSSASKIFLIISIIAGYLSGSPVFFFTLVFTSLYYIYSSPPTKYKIIPFLSSFIIGLCCIVVFLAGFFLVSPVKLVSIMPNSLVFGIFLFFFLFWHVRDVKDIKGDRKENIITAPVLFGEKWGLKATAVISSLAFFVPPIISGIKLFWIPSVLASIVCYYFITTEERGGKYSEKPIFGVYLLYIISLAIIYLK